MAVVLSPSRYYAATFRKDPSLLIYEIGRVVEGQSIKLTGLEKEQRYRPLNIIVFGHTIAPGRQLVKYPDRYTGQVVRTSAIFLTQLPDVRFMYDRDGSDYDSRVIDYTDCSTGAGCDRLKRLRELRRGGDGERWRNRMGVVGRLEIIERQRRSGENTRELKFAVSDIESVSRVPRRVAWP